MRIVLIASLLLAAPTGFVRADVSACDPIGFPCFSIDRNSPAVGPTFGASDLLVPPGPVVVRPSQFFGLPHPLDDLDGISRLNAGTDPTETFLLLFSVDRQSRGIAPPDPNLVALGYPFNVTNQAARGQQAADAFATLDLFDQTGVIPPTPGPGPSLPTLRVGGGNNTLFINQGDASGIDFGVGPHDSPDANSPAPQNDVDGMAGAGASSSPRPLTAMLRGGGPHLADRVFLFSVQADSPSLLMLPGSHSGADIYLAIEPNDPNLPSGIDLYATANQLGLMVADDINALLVFDNGDRVYDPTVDRVIFSLDRMSPTLGLFGATPADLFRNNQAGPPVGYVNAGRLGLGATPDPNGLIFDNVDALDFVPCLDRRMCLLDSAIGTPCETCDGDVTGDNVVDLNDLAVILASFGTPSGATRADGDLNYDGAVNLADLAVVLALFGTSCP